MTAQHSSPSDANCQNPAKESGLPFGATNDFEATIAHKHVNEMKSTPVIARELGVATHIVATRLKKLGVLRTLKEARCRDLTGQRFGRWTVVEQSEQTDSQGYKPFYKCRCDCGTEKDVNRVGLVSGRSASCGCLHKERVSGQRKPYETANCLACSAEFRVFPSGHQKYCSRACAATQENGKKTHGETRTRLHNIWCGMKTRCQPGNVIAHYYGDRGITVCREWSESFESFRDWANANGYQEDLEIDRIDPDCDYEPGNCRWANRSQQMSNTRKRRDGKTSRFKGVSWSKNASKWRAQVSRGRGPHFYDALFDDEEEAARAYDAAALRAFGEYANINFKEES